MSSIKSVTLLVTLLSIVGMSIGSPAPVQGCRFVCGPECNPPPGTIACCMICDLPKFQIGNDVPEAAKMEEEEQDRSVLTAPPAPAAAIEGFEFNYWRKMASPVKEGRGVNDCSGVRRITCHYQCALQMKACNCSTCKCYDN